MSVGFVTELCAAKLELAAGREDNGEETYLKMRDIAESVRERYESGAISGERYAEWTEKYRRLEDRYGFEYD